MKTRVLKIMNDIMGVVTSDGSDLDVFLFDKVVEFVINLPEFFGDLIIGFGGPCANLDRGDNLIDTGEYIFFHE